LVEHEQAKRCSASSISGDVISFSIHNAESPRDWHAYITEACLTDLSLVRSPVNRLARMLRRSPKQRSTSLPRNTAPKYGRALECLVKDRDALLAFYDFPAEHREMMQVWADLPRSASMWGVGGSENPTLRALSRPL
jgi:hypothetical protein